MTDPVSTNNPLNNVTVPLPPGTSTAPVDSGMGKDTFLKLLVAQLKYQNPMSPADGTQFLAQTAQFSMVEKLTDLDTQLTTMMGAQKASTATGMLGQQIIAKGNDGKDVTGIVTGMRITADGPVLKIGNAEYAYDSVKEVDTPPAATAPAPAAPAPTPTTPPTTTPSPTPTA
jgi:flagellar basal-body rod modification protein FlgD